MLEKKKLKILNWKGRKLWIDDDQEQPEIEQLANNMERYLDFFSDYLRPVRIKAKREPPEEMYITRRELQKLERRLAALEERFLERAESFPARNVGVLLESLTSRLRARKFHEIKEGYYRLGEKILDLYLVAGRFSGNLLEGISKIEVSLSREMPELSIEIKPIVCKEDIPEKAIPFSVK